MTAPLGRRAALASRLAASLVRPAGAAGAPIRIRVLSD